MIGFLDSPRGSLLETSLKKLEKSFGVPFPISYRNFLLTSNGGECFKGFTLSKGNAVYIADFFGILEEKSSEYQSSDILGVYKNYRKLGWIPEQAIFIADDGSSAKIMLSLEKDTFGQMFYWNNYELNTDFEGDLISDFSNISWLSRDFETLVGNPELEET